MKIEGGCYCGDIRYESTGEPQAAIQCHCRECQYIAGGSPVLILGVPSAGFAYTQGEPKAFRRKDLEAPVTREFCPECGTHLLTRSPKRPGAVIVKVGGMDDPGLFEKADIAIFTCDKQSFHAIADGVTAYERRPG